MERKSAAAAGGQPAREKAKPSPATRRRRRIDWLTGVLFALPVIIGILLFNYYPTIRALINSFTASRGRAGIEFVKFKHYITALSFEFEGKLTLQIFGNTLVYALVSVPFGLIVGYFLALAANFKLKGISVYRMLFYLPVIIPGVASGILFVRMFADTTQHGIFNQLFTSLGLPEASFFRSEKTSLITLIFMGIWSAGGSMIIWLSAFKNIPANLYEAAKLDGANSLQCLAKITIPMSTPLIFYNLVTGIIGGLQCTTPLVVVGNGGGEWDRGAGVGNSLYFVAVKIMNEFNLTFYEYASALAFLLFFIVGIFTFILFKTSKWVFYGEEEGK